MRALYSTKKRTRSRTKVKFTSHCFGLVSELHTLATYIKLFTLLLLTCINDQRSL